MRQIKRITPFLIGVVLISTAFLALFFSFDSPSSDEFIPIVSPASVNTDYAVSTLDRGAVVDRDVLADLREYRNLPVGSITSHPVSDAWGTVIFIPQNHRYPGSQSSDTVNDSAELAQKQIYEILSYIYERFRVDFVMAEGDLYGVVPHKKIANLSAKIDARNTFVQEIGTLKDTVQRERFDPALKQSLFEYTDRFIASLDREIILEGASYKLKAEGASFTLFGSENENTREESARIVRNYVYLNDRLHELTGFAQRSSGVSSPFTRNSGQLLSLSSPLPQSYELLLSRDLFLGGNILELYFSLLESSFMFRGDSALLNVVDASREAYNTIQALRGEEQKRMMASSASSIPSRQDNPYRSIRSPEKIKSLLVEAEREIEEIVVVQRNEETAENFARALREEGSTIGVLQFGAGHEQGLIEELNEQGLFVIVITPEEVLRRNSTS